MSYTTRVFVEDCGWQSFNMVANIFASNPYDLKEFLYGNGSIEGLPELCSSQVEEQICRDDASGSVHWHGETFMEAYRQYYNKHSLRRLFKRKYVERVMDIIAWFVTEETDSGGRIICHRTF